MKITVQPSYHQKMPGAQRIRRAYAMYDQDQRSWIQAKGFVLRIKHIYNDRI